MGALTTQESNGKRDAVGPVTPYGRALGSTQMLPATAAEQAHKLGVAYRPDLMTGTSDEAGQYQQQLGSSYLHEGLDKTGNLYDALRYYHGGPNRRLWGPKTNAYAISIMSRLAG